MTVEAIMPSNIILLKYYEQNYSKSIQLHDPLVDRNLIRNRKFW